MTKPPLQCMCVESGALRPRFDMPKEPPNGHGLIRLFEMATALHMITGINSTIPETRAYWREKCPETKPLWKVYDD